MLSEDVFETPDDSIATIRNQLQTSEGQQPLRDQFGPLSRKYIEALLNPKNDTIDRVYGVYLDKDGTLMIGNKRFDVDKADNIIIDNVQYVGTRGLYELIFMKKPSPICTHDDMQKYKSILLATDAYRLNYNPNSRINGNRAEKYKHIIAPLVLKEPRKKSGKGLPRAMTLNENVIDYVHWDDPNELVDRLRLLDASRQAGNNAHDNEILSIIDELREVGLIIN